MHQLYVRRGRRYRAAADADILDVAAAIIATQAHGVTITNPREAANLCRSLCAGYDREHFGAVFLDTHHRVIDAQKLFSGTIDGAAVYPRVIVKRALELNAAAAILTHNHPSGVAEPSEADRNITVRVSKALALVDIRLLDHLVVTGDACVSLAERGWL